MVEQFKHVYLHGWGFTGAVFGDNVSEKTWPPGEAPSLYEAARRAGVTSCASVANRLLDNIAANSIAIGWSLGGQVAIEMATQSDKVRALILIASSPLLVNRSDWSYGINEHDYEELRSGFQINPKKTIKKMLALTAHGDENERETIRKLVAHTASLDDGEILGDLLDEMSGNDLRAQLQKLNIPVLLILGEGDALIDSRMVNAIGQDNIKTETLGTCGHAPFISKGQRIGTIMKRFEQSLEKYEQPFRD